MTTSILTETDKRIICETAEDILRKNPGRTRFMIIWTCIRETCPELAELYKSNKKDKINNEALSTMLEWQQKHPSKIGYAKVGSKNWFWYGDTAVMPQPASMMKSMVKKPTKKVAKLSVGKTTLGNIKMMEGQADKISDVDKKVICETAEEWLKDHPGRTRLSQLCVFMRKECHRVLEIYMRYKKKGHAIGFGVYHVLNLWQAANPQKIGRVVLPEPLKDTAWFWYGGGTEPPQPSDREKTKASASELIFYAPFVKWLEKRKECDKAISTGDKRGQKWSCPDVVGIKKLQKYGGSGHELVSAEIKIGEKLLPDSVKPVLTSHSVINPIWLCQRIQTKKNCIGLKNYANNMTLALSFSIRRIRTTRLLIFATVQSHAEIRTHLI